MMYDDVMDTLSMCIRGVFIPSEGKSFYGGDYSSIEARVLLWLADSKGHLDMFRKGKDLYVELAKAIFDVDKVTADQRFLGKTGVLGCGFGMGWEKFIGTCAQWGVEISEELAKTVVKVYRDKNTKVVKLWATQEQAAMQAIRTNKVVQAGKVSWGMHEGFLFCLLPSGRPIAYYHPMIEPMETPWGQMKETITYMSSSTEPGKARGWRRTKTYGGKLVENITQAVARDVMAEAMLRSEDAGYEVVLSVHDELLTEKEDGSVEEFENIMKVLPEWAEGLPVDVEGWEGKRYLK